MFDLVLVQNDLMFIKVHLYILIRAIINLEDTKLILYQLLEIMNRTISKLSNKPGDKIFKLKLKYFNYTTKNRISSIRTN